MPIELKLAGVGLLGIALIGLGLRLAIPRPGYGLSLQGAGAGVLYLTTYAAFHLYGVLADAPAVGLLVSISALTVWLAVRSDSQPLATLAVAGAVIAPMLVAAGGRPALLFGYFAIVNAAIFVLAWVRAWRALNALGFVFTFVLGIVWGHGYYRPEHYATVQPFLVLFFVFAYQFSQAESVRAMIAWAAGCLWSATAMGLFKIAYMMELNKNSVTREIKRLELELAHLSRRLLEK